MYYEFLKIRKNRWTVLITLLSVICCCVVFYNGLFISENGNDMREIRKYYSAVELPVIEDVELQVPDMIITTETEALQRVRETENYSQSIKQLIAENQMKIQSGLFGGPDSFEVKSMKKSIEVYQKLTDLTVPSDWHGGIEKLIFYRYTDLFVLIGSFAVSLLLFVQERKEKFSLVTRSTSGGQKTLYRRKCLTVITYQIFVYTISVIVLFLISMNLGIGKLNDPIQSVHGMMLCPYRISIGLYLVISYVFHVAVLSAITILALFVFSIGRKILLLTVSVVLLFVAVVPLKTNSLFIQSLSPITALDTSRILSSEIYLNILGIPVNRFFMIIAMSVLYIIPLVLFGSRLWLANMPEHQMTRKSIRQLRLPSSSGMQETRKFWLKSGALLMIVILILVQSWLYLSRKDYINGVQRFYQQYSEVLHGTPDADKEKYLQMEQEKIDHMELSMIRQMQEQGYQKALLQYQSLDSDGFYMDRTVYEEMFSSSGIRRDVIHMIMMCIVIACVVGNDQASEYETGMNYLISTYGKEKKVFHYKRINTIVFVLLTSLICFLPEFFYMNSLYGLNDLTESAVSSGISSLNIPVFMLLVIIMLVRILIGMFYAFMTGKIATVTGKKVSAVATASAMSIAFIVIYLIL